MIFPTVNTIINSVSIPGEMPSLFAKSYESFKSKKKLHLKRAHRSAHD